MSVDSIQVVGSCYDEAALYCVDQDEKIKVFDFMALQKREFFDYEFFLTSSEEMNMIIKGYQNLPVQLSFVPQRMNRNLIKEEFLSITNFLDPPIDFWLGTEFIYFLYKDKIIIYKRSEVLTLGRLKTFEQMSATMSHYSYIIWELDLKKKRIEKCYPKKNETIVVVLDVIPSLGRLTSTSLSMRQT